MLGDTSEELREIVSPGIHISQIESLIVALLNVFFITQIGGNENLAIAPLDRSSRIKAEMHDRT
ncbi:hypothetical protein [Microcoleus sp. D2_18a_B4]|uniref:hypothetical protein n=1 Tax=Microcoleus sp. D2_18a_B4 TaxID=3055329 RepID=UPI002FD41CDC